MYRGKMKTKKAVSKRFRLTASGRLKFKRPGMRHLLAHKSSKRKRQLLKPGYVAKVDRKRIRTWLPYA